MDVIAILKFILAICIIAVVLCGLKAWLVNAYNAIIGKDVEKGRVYGGIIGIILTALHWIRKK